MGFKESKWVFKKPNGFGVIQMGPHGLHELHMGLGDPMWVHMGFIGCACRSRWRANIARSASFGLPDLAARTGCGDKTAHRPPPPRILIAAINDATTATLKTAFRDTVRQVASQMGSNGFGEGGVP